MSTRHLKNRTLSDEARKRLEKAFRETLEAGSISPANIPGLGTFSRAEMVRMTVDTLVANLETVGDELPPDEFWWEFEEGDGP